MLLYHTSHDVYQNQIHSVLISAFHYLNIFSLNTGLPVFPHWHRIFTVQFEQALKEHGSVVGVPYWDWTAPGTALPPYITDTSSDNPFSSYTIRFAGQVGLD